MSNLLIFFTVSFTMFIILSQCGFSTVFLKGPHGKDGIHGKTNPAGR